MWRRVAAECWREKDVSDFGFGRAGEPFRNQCLSQGAESLFWGSLSLSYVSEGRVVPQGVYLFVLPAVGSELPPQAVWCVG